MNLRETILNAKDIKEELLEVPEWGVTLLIRGMTGKTRAAMIISGGASSASIFTEMVIASAYDPQTNQPVFTPIDMEALNERAAGVLQTIGQVALRLSGMGPDAAEQAEKNSKAVSGGITSPLPSGSTVQ